MNAAHTWNGHKMQNVGQVTGKKRVNVATQSKNKGSNGGGSGTTTTTATKVASSGNKNSNVAAAAAAATAAAVQTTATSEQQPKGPNVPGRTTTTNPELAFALVSEPSPAATAPPVRPNESESDEESVSEVKCAPFLVGTKKSSFIQT